MTKFTLGQKVRFKATLKRVTKYDESRGWNHGRMKIWKRQPESAGDGIVIGPRTLTDGYSWWTGDEYAFKPIERHKAVLIASHPRHKPTYAFIEDVKALPSEAAELIEAVERYLDAVAERKMSTAYDVMREENQAGIALRAALAKWKERNDE